MQPETQPAQVSAGLLPTMRGMLDDVMQEHLSVLRQDIQNAHLDMVKQFQIQQVRYCGFVG
jgi:hypothetical protein